MVWLALIACLACGGRNGGAGVWAELTQGFTLAIAPSSLEIPAGGSGYLTVSVKRHGHFAGAIALGITGLPAGVTASGTILEGASSGRMILAVAEGVPVQSLGTLSVQGASGSVKGTTNLTLRILAALPASSLSADRAAAAGGIQAMGALQNAAVALEPVAASTSKNSTGAVEVRHGFQPVSQPDVP